MLIETQVFHANCRICHCYFTGPYSLHLVFGVAVIGNALLFTKIALQNSFRPHPQQVMGPGTWDFCWKHGSEIVNVIVIVPVTWSDKINFSMSTTSDFKVQTEKLEGPDDWSKWKWHILMPLSAHCLERIADGSRKCSVLPADAQPQQKKELTEWRQTTSKLQALSHAR